MIKVQPFGGSWQWVGDVQARMNWSLDFWGRQAALIEKARGTARAAALDAAAARQAFPGRRIVAAFQPHLYSRTAEHGVAMGDALTGADLVVVTDVYPAREQPIPGVTGERVANAARDCGAETVYEPDRQALAERVAGLVREGDVVVTLGAGDITRLGSELRARLGER